MNDEEVNFFFSKNVEKCNELLDLFDEIKQTERNILEKHKLLNTYSDQILNLEERLDKANKKLKKLLSKNEKLSEMYLRLVVKEETKQKQIQEQEQDE